MIERSIWSRPMLPLGLLTLIGVFVGSGTAAAQNYNYPTPFGSYSDENDPTQLRVLWTMPQGSNNAGFVIYRKTTVGSWTPQLVSQAHTIQINQAAAREYIDTGLQPNTYYNYMICATYNQQTGGLFTQCPPQTTYLQGRTAPDGPRNLTLTPINQSSIKLDWQHNLTTRTGYVVQRRQGGSWTQLADLSATTLTYTHQNLQPTTSYEYRVCARFSSGLDDGNCSAPKSAQTFAATSAPTGVHIDEGALYQTGIPNHPDVNRRNYRIYLFWTVPVPEPPTHYSFTASGGPQPVGFRDGTVQAGQLVAAHSLLTGTGTTGFMGIHNIVPGHTYNISVCAEYGHATDCASTNYTAPAIYRPAFSDISLGGVGHYKVDVQWSYNDGGHQTQVQQFELFVYNRYGNPSKPVLDHNNYYEVFMGLAPMGPNWERLSTFGGGTTSGNFEHDWRSESMLASLNTSFPSIDIVHGPRQYTLCATNAMGRICSRNFLSAQAGGITAEQLMQHASVIGPLEVIFSNAGLQLYLRSMNRSSDERDNQIYIERNAGRGWQRVGPLDLKTGRIEDRDTRGLQTASYRACTLVGGRPSCSGETSVDFSKQAPER